LNAAEWLRLVLFMNSSPSRCVPGQESTLPRVRNPETTSDLAFPMVSEREKACLSRFPLRERERLTELLQGLIAVLGP